MSSSVKQQDGPAKVTFEDGYERMKEISARLETGDLSVAEMCESYAEGKGLGKALLAYLEEREGELKEIDEGKNLPAFEVIASAPAASEEPSEEIPF